jgi:putative hemolysin
MNAAPHPKKLLNQDEVRHFLGWPTWTNGLIWLLFFVLGWHRLNRVYQRHAHRHGMDFVRALIQSRGIKLRYFESDLDRIPRSGGALLVANHPLGAVDGLLLLDLVHSIRPDVKIMANGLLQRIEPLKPYLIGVTPFEGRHARPFQSGKGLLMAKNHVETGGILLFFPAGEVSHFNWKQGKIQDRPWPKSSLRFLSEVKAPCLPIDVHASLSTPFYLLGQIHPYLYSALLPGEAVRKRWFYPVDIRIGKPMHKRSAMEPLAFAHILEHHRRQLRANPPKEKTARIFPIRVRKAMPIAMPGAPSAWEQEIEALDRLGKSLTRSSQLEVYLAHAKEIPMILLEIGRLRELTFRQVGEGSGLARDLDRFDASYQHLILWDHGAKQILGAYRLGFGPDLVETARLRGFYLRDFFKFKKEAIPFLTQCLEMGRAFVIPEAQQKPLPLFLLWKGIVHVLVRHSDRLRYVVGSVSISNSYSKHSQAVMLAFVKHHFADRKWSPYIKSRKKFKLRLRKEDRTFIESSSPADVQQFDRMISDMEPQGLRMPVLIKRYVGQNARVIAFNRDPDFNTVDALMYMDVLDLPEATLQPVLEELKALNPLPGVEGVDQAQT